MDPMTIAMLAVFAVKETRSLLAENPSATDAEIAARVAKKTQEIAEILNEIKIREGSV